MDKVPQAYNGKVKKKTSKKGHNSATKSPTEKKNNTGPLIFLYLFHISNFKILSLTVLDKMQSVTHVRTHGWTDGQDQTNMPPQLLRNWGHNKLNLR